MCTVVIWRPVVGFEEKYQVSSHGDVYSNPSRRLLTPHVGNNGYHELTIRRNRRPSLVRVHSLVAEAFFGPRPEGQYVRHGDDIGVHNCYLNLSYGTPKENSADMIRNGNHWRQSQTECVNGHEFTEENTYWRVKGGRDCKACRRVSRNKCNKKRRQRAKEALAAMQ